MEITQIQLEQLLNKQGLGIIEIAKKLNYSCSNIYRLIRLWDIKRIHQMTKQCMGCGKEYQATTTNGIHLRQKWCSKECRESIWRKENPGKIKAARRRQLDRIKQVNILCRGCQSPIPKERRSCGVVYCSDACVKDKQQHKQRIKRKQAQQRFDEYKMSRGCTRCGYNKCSRSMDFHHIDPKQKDRRITATHFVSQSFKIKEELKKCILVCKNCHYELHDLMQNNIDRYWKEINENCN